MPTFRHAAAPVRLGEFDLGGVLYHANYFHLYEEAREAVLATHGLPYSLLANRGEHLAVVESHQEFLAPVRYGDPLIVELTFGEIRRTSFVVRYRVLQAAGDGACVNRAMTRHAFIQTANGTFAAGKIPAELLGILQQYSAE